MYKVFILILYQIFHNAIRDISLAEGNKMNLCRM